MTSKIIIYYMDGKVEEYYGTVNITKYGFLIVFPQGESTVSNIPLCNVKKYIVE
ncbi:MAG: hypothetical protein PHY47_26840 [Lachnospiraceae bacterium]|nr:hypothetical protein [Lachnospiraceae bacterium]